MNSMDPKKAAHKRRVSRVSFFFLSFALLGTPGTSATSSQTTGTLVSWGSTVLPYIPPNTKYKAAVRGPYHGLAIKADGALIAWGNNDSGQCDVPARLPAITSIAAGAYHSLALQSDGTVVGWGQMVVPAGLSNIIAIAAGYYHSVALKRDGTVTAWGESKYGQTLFRMA
jgi:trimeric autotransporter adhesin